MKKIILALLTLLGVSCTLWQPFGAQSTEPWFSSTPSPTEEGLQKIANPTQYVLTPQICTVTAEALNVRSDPGTSYPVLYWLHKGDTVTYLLISGAWLATDTGWIHGSYCDENH